MLSEPGNPKLIEDLSPFKTFERRGPESYPQIRKEEEGAALVTEAGGWRIRRRGRCDPVSLGGNRAANGGPEDWEADGSTGVLGAGRQLHINQFCVNLPDTWGVRPLFSELPSLAKGISAPFSNVVGFECIGVREASAFEGNEQLKGEGFRTPRLGPGPPPRVEYSFSHARGRKKSSQKKNFT